MAGYGQVASESHLGELGLCWSLRESRLREEMMAEAGPVETFCQPLEAPGSGAGLVVVERNCWHRYGSTGPAAGLGLRAAEKQGAGCCFQSPLLRGLHWKAAQQGSCVHAPSRANSPSRLVGEAGKAAARRTRALDSGHNEFNSCPGYFVAGSLRKSHHFSEPRTPPVK